MTDKKENMLKVVKNHCPPITEGKARPLRTMATLHPVLFDNKEIYAYTSTIKGDDMRIVEYPTLEDTSSDYYQRSGFDRFYMNHTRESCIRDALNVSFRRTSFITHISLEIEDREGNPLPSYRIKSNKLVKIIEIVSNSLLEFEILDYTSINDVKPPKHEGKLVSSSVLAVIAQPEASDNVLEPYLNNFIALLSGQQSTTTSSYAWTSSHMYRVHTPVLETGKTVEFLIINKPITGFVHMRTVDNRFYLKYERTSEGALIGEMVRTQLIPYHEQPTSLEVAGCIEDGGQSVPVYFSYYDPAGSGKQITRKEYEQYLKERAYIVQENTGFPRELTQLLDF